tara:strand:- start:2435 stop:3430 length:996 start_codon:yes stop_codon:yes gene_type:complete
MKKFTEKDLKKTPILVLGFNRSFLFNDCVKRLKSNGFKNIWVSIDGPRNGNREDIKNNKEIKDYCNQNNIDKSKMLFSEKNNGCRKGVINGITWFFKNNKKGIIVEDDIEIDNEYLKKISYLLNKFENDKEIFSISSYSECNDIKLSSNLKNNLNFFKSPLCRVWGWATWNDRWEKHLFISNKYISKNPISCFFSLPYKFRTSNTALRLAFCKSGKIDTWDYELNFSHIYSNSFSITPMGLFSLNYGFGPEATHTKYGDMPWLNMDNYSFQDKNSIKFINLNTNAIKKIGKATGFDYGGNSILEFIKLIINMLKIKINYYLKRFIIEINKT